MGGLALGSVVAHRWMCDHFGHMNVRHYAAAFDDATFLFWSHAGFVAGNGPMPVTLEVTTRFVQETKEGAINRISAELIRIGGKSASVRLTMTDAVTGGTVATCDVTECFIDPDQRQSCAIPDHIRATLVRLPQVSSGDQAVADTRSAQDSITI